MILRQSGRPVHLQDISETGNSLVCIFFRGKDNDGISNGIKIDIWRFPSYNGGYPHYHPWKTRDFPIKQAMISSMGNQFSFFEKRCGANFTQVDTIDHAPSHGCAEWNPPWLGMIPVMDGWDGLWHWVNLTFITGIPAKIWLYRDTIGIIIRYH